jgi:hypothetical protein
LAAFQKLYCLKKLLAKRLPAEIVHTKIKGDFLKKDIKIRLGKTINWFNLCKIFLSIMLKHTVKYSPRTLGKTGKNKEEIMDYLKNLVANVTLFVYLFHNKIYLRIIFRLGFACGFVG